MEEATVKLRMITGEMADTGVIVILSKLMITSVPTIYKIDPETIKNYLKVSKSNKNCECNNQQSGRVQCVSVTFSYLIDSVIH